MLYHCSLQKSLKYCAYIIITKRHFPLILAIMIMECDYVLVSLIGFYLFLVMLKFTSCSNGLKLNCVYSSFDYNYKHVQNMNTIES